MLEVSIALLILGVAVAGYLVGKEQAKDESSNSGAGSTRPGKKPTQRRQ